MTFFLIHQFDRTNKRFRAFVLKQSINHFVRLAHLVQKALCQQSSIDYCMCLSCTKKTFSPMCSRYWQVYLQLDFLSNRDLSVVLQTSIEIDLNCQVLSLSRPISCLSHNNHRVMQNYQDLDVSN